MGIPHIDYATMLQQLHAFCAINSGTDNLSGLAQMHDELYTAFEPLADVIESLSMPPLSSISMAGDSVLRTTGNSLLIKKRPHLKHRVLLCGHMDTVYGTDNPFQALRTIDSNTLNGPGVADMKGGLVVMLHALLAFEKMECAHQLGWDVFINADEEIGSSASSAMMVNIAQHCQAALVFEPAMTTDGVLAKNRKGNGKITLVATGVAAHAGRDFGAGRNAICFLADIILAIHALNGQRDGVTLNVGLISGGSSLNSVPDKAVAKVDVRITYPEDERWVRDQLHNIQAHHQKPDFSLSIDSRFDRPVKRINPATEHLFLRLRELGKTMKFTMDWKDSGGCCDGNNLAQHGLAVIDTLGVRGGNIHTADEFILLDSLVERATLSALLLADLANDRKVNLIQV